MSCSLFGVTVLICASMSMHECPRSFLSLSLVVILPGCDASILHKMTQNRDRLELYALHKQSVSGDAPPATTDDSSSSSSVADKAKLAAWRTKRGMTQAEAMQRYVEECKYTTYMQYYLLQTDSPLHSSVCIQCVYRVFVARM